MKFSFPDEITGFEEYCSVQLNTVEYVPNESHFLSQFKFLQKNFTDTLLTKLRHIVPEDDYLITNCGDWHNFQRTSVCMGMNGNTVVYKPKCSEAELFIQKILAGINNNIQLNIFLPKISAYNTFFTQEYVPAGTQGKASNFAIGGIFAIGYWYGILDLHKKNISFNRDGIIIYDSDCLFNSHQGAAFHDRLNNIGLVRLDPNAFEKSGLNALSFDFDKTEVLNGFKATIECLLKTTDNSHYEIMDSIPVRKILLPTREYFKILQQRFTLGWSDSLLILNWTNFRKSKGYPPIWEGKILELEIQSLLNWNIPFFYHKGDTLMDFEQTQIVNNLKRSSLLMRKLHAETIRNRGRLIQGFDNLLYKYAQIRNL